MEKSEMMFRKANRDEISGVCDLYKSLLGSEFCVWNEYYPSIEEAREDYVKDNLFVLVEGDSLVGAVSLVDEKEMEDLDCWHIKGDAACEGARLAIAPDYHGRNLSRRMVEEIVNVAKSRGYQSFHLSVAEENVPAIKTYYKVDFEKVGEADLYNNHHYLLFEKIL